MSSHWFPSVYATGKAKLKMIPKSDLELNVFLLQVLYRILRWRVQTARILHHLQHDSVPRHVGRLGPPHRPGTPAQLRTTSGKK